MAMGQLVFDLVARTDRMTRGLSNARRGLSSFVSSGMAMLAKFHHATLGLRTAFSLLSEPLALADTQLKAERKLEQVFKSTGGAAGFAADEIKKFAAERQKVTNFGDEATIDAAAVLGSFTNIRGDAFKQALVSAQDLSAFLNSDDLQSSVIQLGKALNDPARNLSALARSGIQFSESQTETIKKLQEVGMIAEAQQLILREFQKQFGGQAEALAEPIKQAKNTWSDFLEEVGKGVREIAEEILNEFGFEDMTQNMSEFVQKFRDEWKEDVVEGIKEAATVAKDLWEVFKGIAETLKPIVKGISDMDKGLKNMTGGGEDSPGLLKLAQSPTGFAMDWFKGGGANALGAGTGKAPGVPPSAASDFLDGPVTQKRSRASLIFGDTLKPKQEEDFSFLQDQGPTIPKELLKEREAMERQAEKIAQSVRTPAEEFADRIDELTTLFEGGFINEETFDRAAKAAQEMLPEDIEEKARNQVRSLEAQSAEAFDVLRANVAPDSQKKIPEKQLKELEKISKGIDKISKHEPTTIEERGFD